MSLASIISFMIRHAFKSSKIDNCAALKIILCAWNTQEILVWWHQSRELVIFSWSLVCLVFFLPGDLSVSVIVKCKGWDLESRFSMASKIRLLRDLCEDSEILAHNCFTLRTPQLRGKIQAHFRIDISSKIAWRIIARKRLKSLITLIGNWETRHDLYSVDWRVKNNPPLLGIQRAWN